MPQPLVSIICLCYNHERFIKEALDSVLAQTYSNLELIVVDDSSTDNSTAIIEDYCRRFPQLTYISTGQNLGNTKAFNLGWRASRGELIIDFATDDVLLPDRVEKQVQAIAELDQTYGVIYSNAEYINDESEHLYYHSENYKPAPDGNVFREVLERYFICPPTMMMRRSVLEELGGYDETLAYEDFDFWVRSARNWKYSYLDYVTTQRRLHQYSLSQKYYTSEGRMMQSTIKVCEKAAGLVADASEKKALVKRLKYEIRHAYLTNHFIETAQFLKLLQQQQPYPGLLYTIIKLLNKRKIKLSGIRDLYFRLRYRN
ncbi:glycosyltransferase [Pontibacter sp. KCTC 32443]|uniref:glycosyltransferase family 2 protein n=1 Tax=Pontibacter TaxID=323449 RepID=UPI00164DE561|nr:MULTISPECIES: glycosyltransferase [Pontibacter]MBC5775313.1 glycosyltransferase [Pontibacter sp. KCTC 32443]